MSEQGQEDLFDEDGDFRTFWQRGPVKIVGAVVVLGLLGGGLYLAGIAEWLGDRYRDVVGEARYAQLAFEEDVLEHSPIGEVHAELLPAYTAAIVQSGNPEDDPRIDELLDRIKRRAGDEELSRIIDELHAGLLAEKEDHSEIERAWNDRVAEMGHPYAIQGGGLEDHGHFLYMPETYRIVAAVDVDVDGQTHHVEWRHRLDNFRRAAEPTFYDADRDHAWVRSDRGWITLWGTLAPLLLSDHERAAEELGESTRRDFQWRDELRAELSDFLGEEDFQALLRGATRQQQLESIALEIGHRGNRCNHNFRVVRTPWLGYDSDELDRFRRLANDDRYAECPRVTTDEAARLRRISRDLQSDLAYQRVMPRLLAAFLGHKTVMSAAHRHRSTSGEALCSDCEEWSHEDAAEIGGYLTGTRLGPLPLLGLFRTCFDHRYGSQASYRGWLLLLRDQGFDCRGEMPDDLLGRLAAVEEERFFPIDQISFIDELPEATPIYRRD